ncbi:hypothetical protein [Polymorphospora sp. A560]|uniref:hypothetical protein n=1 Tax=Polymorphospora sp. A560 TaxID=3040203 RepID=UPI00389230F3
MDAAPPPPAPHQRALAHVAALSTGPPLDPGLRVTLNMDVSSNYVDTPDQSLI